MDGARELLQRATREPGSAKRREKLDDKPVQERVHRSTKLWCFYADLEESYGTVKTTMASDDLPCNVRREGGQSLVIGGAIPCNIRREGG